MLELNHPLHIGLKRRFFRRFYFAGWLHAVMLAPILTVPTEPALGQNPTAGRDEIEATIRDLGSASYETRQSAMRRLTILGPPARKQLEDAVQGEDFEVRLRAKQLLADQDRLLLAGVEVSLECSKDQVVWDEPVDLFMTFQNRSEFPAKLPFEAASLSAASAPAVQTDADQVARMLDVADWLTVKGLDHQITDLRVDEISLDPDVVAAVQRRLNGIPLALLEPGQKFTIAVRAWNRGWARYPLLDAGTYSIVFDYIPLWDDDELNARRIGRVTSTTATLRILNSAPANVSRAGVPSMMTLERQGDFLVAALINTADRAALINRNFGMAPPFAQADWIIQVGEITHRVPAMAKAPVSWDEFESSKLTELAPGAALEVARIHVAELRNKLPPADAQADPRAAVKFSYANQCDRAWQLRQGASLLGNPKAPTVLRSLVPRGVLSTFLTSDELPASSIR